VVARSGLPLETKARIAAFTVRLPDGAVLPSPRDAMRRLLHLALLKMPFIVKNLGEAITGYPPFDPEAATSAALSAPPHGESAPEASLPENDTEEPDPEEEKGAAPEGEGIGGAEGDVPSRWTDELELVPARIRENLGRLEFSDALVDQVATALSSGKHLLLVGPPGTGRRNSRARWSKRPSRRVIAMARTRRRPRRTGRHPRRSAATSFRRIARSSSGQARSSARLRDIGGS
jgi:hypothetical protein